MQITKLVAQLWNETLAPGPTFLHNLQHGRYSTSQSWSTDHLHYNITPEPKKKKKILKIRLGPKSRTFRASSFKSLVSPFVTWRDWIRSFLRNFQDPQQKPKIPTYPIHCGRKCLKNSHFIPKNKNHKLTHVRDFHTHKMNKWFHSQYGLANKKFRSHLKPVLISQDH